ncbi:MAG: N-acetylglutaminylglutamine amidotransferase [Gammaproteobacteria bacterium]|nr:N-acetylglutaminylglutamine amidotransferase [Gammaproteobacteria bacterium]MCP5425123.1 N-acetylglutaminylglutamine amidotransferase [Gammaproteobacteria bacterium]MCP5459810.1 N-acetylglutaminylglutamine amidotransferase [Gammaproteobacteria bacterium]
MCGISGEIRFDGQTPDPTGIQAMNDRMRARGPDDAGVFCIGSRAFGHRRLMIMDLSPNSQQPMFDPNLGLGIVFNGAIYNHPQLRQTLREMGYSFYSDGDTEVILKAYHAWGADCLQRFNGMFAFAIWERDSGRTFLARDRLGIKPLYYTRQDKFMRFASSLPALLAAGGVDKSIDPVALNYYLNFHAVVPAPHTIVSGIKKVPPGHYLLTEADGKTQQVEYWRLEFNPQSGDAERSFEDWRLALLEELRNAVKRRRVAAVDVGVLLSGGVDSSLLVGLMAESGVSGLNTYSVGFETVGDEVGDEFKYSDIIARHYGTAHHQIRVSSTELLEQLPQAILAMSEPMVSHDCIGFYLLSREVSKTCKAVQSGQGADEVFGGYHWYPPLVGSTEPFAAYRKAFFDRDFAEYQQVVQPPWVDGDHASDFVEQHFAKSGASDPVNKALRLDTTIMLVDDPVKRVDNMTMAWGLEARVPFLDHELVEFAARMPSSIKVAEEGKYVLKEAARAVIPSAVIDRPKGYFPVPALKYLQGSVLDYVRDALLNSRAQQRGLFRKEYVNSLLDDPERHITPLRGSKLWQLGLLEIWLQAQEL